MTPAEQEAPGWQHVQKRRWHQEPQLPDAIFPHIACPGEEEERSPGVLHRFLTAEHARISSNDALFLPLWLTAILTATRVESGGLSWTVQQANLACLLTVRTVVDGHERTASN